ncbi:TonB-dependent receptor [Pedobacter metabolipauper]|uniref:TonB-linked SusC/RagA family outer membrane protein n=1 Tax=Pedobacter metabolipauper TaxID=425513 RepID=A0A4R6SXP6_9SPHI|nr:TonB-dependent receptor [Pedobacter metabolipauper]TDQ11294.1 TonB-linked SusC/RagA family outer membrane protein [Pedobacter metabolipauper]
MYKFYTVILCGLKSRVLTKFLLTMKLFCILLLASIMQVSASGYAQMVSMKKKNAPMTEVINDIQNQTGYSFIISSDLLKRTNPVSVTLTNVALKDALDQCFYGQPFDYVINNKTIVITNKRSPALIIPKVQIIVTGKITDEKGLPLIGVNITIKGTQTGTSTDANGNYKIPVTDANTVLVYTLVGMSPQEISVTNRTTINVTLREAQTGLNEVIVVGYGTQVKKDITGAISSIKDRDLHERPITNITQALQGKAAGVYVTMKTGSNNGNEPGANPAILIRGRRSLDAANDPLYVIDGIPINGGFNDINPDDIISVDILKDASSTAIYGSRGSNGVIIITTRRGKLGAASVNYNTYAAIGAIARYIDVMTGPEFAEYKRESRRAAGTYVDGAPDADSKLFEATELASIANGSTTDWQRLMLKNEFRQNHELNINGGTEKTKYSVSFGFMDDKGYNPTQSYKRYSSRINLDQDLGERFKVGVSTLATFSKGNNANSYNTTLVSNPLGQPYDANGMLLFLPTADALQPNPLSDLVDGAVISRNNRFRILSSFYGEAKIVDGLTLRMNFGPDLVENRSGSYFSPNTTYRNLAQSTASVSEDFAFLYTWENIINYKKTFAKKHKIDLTGLYSVSSRVLEATGSSAQGLPLESFEYYNMGAAGTITGISSSYEKWSILSYMGRANYSFNDKYLLTVTARADGSSRFGADHKWGFFPSAALGWNIMSEDFMKNIEAISNLKLRVSYGKIGNTGVTTYSTQGRLGRTQYDFGGSDAFGYRPLTIRNDDLRWESTTALNLGLDFGLLNSRIAGAIEVYQSETNDLLLQKVLPASGGFGSVLQNIGSTRNKGIEFSVSTQNILPKSENGFSWSTDLNLFASKERITELSQGKVSDIGSARFIGQPIAVFYDYKKIGIWQTGEAVEAAKYSSAVGQVKVQDTDGNGKIDANDRVIVGTDLPDLTGGITNRFTFKRFTLSALVIANFGNTFVSPIYENGNNVFAFQGRYNNLNVNYWTKNNPTNDFPQPNNATSGPLFSSSLKYFDGSFVKIKNLSLGYEFDSKFAKKIAAKSLRIYGSVQDPFVFAPYVRNYNGTDPEIPGRPALVTYTFGLNVSF